METGGNKVAERQIKKFDDPALRQACRPVAEVNDRVRQLLGDMAETMYASPNGGGLAANQVGILKRLVVIDLGEGLIQLVNPEIVEQEGEQVTLEGCLSFPNVWGTVRRPARVVVKALNERGEPITIEGRDMLAKCLCHEIDHLDGKVFVDKVIKLLDLK